MPATSYDILIGTDLIGCSGEAIAARLGLRQCLIITDDRVGPLYAEKTERALATAGHKVLQTLAVPHGEGSKGFATLEQVLTHMLQQKMDRGSLVIALGGGVVGDMAGLAASLYMRGIDYVQMPTTLLAQVDSSVGGKTGINMPQGKNMVGAFTQPSLVISDTDTFATLPHRHRLAGYAEIVKYSLIGDRVFLDWCRRNSSAVLQGDPAALDYAIAVSCRTKAAVVIADEKERGQRALLNLGHTFGHALEAAAGYGDTLLHGEAVAIGTLLAFATSKRMGHVSAEEAGLVTAHFEEAGLPISPPRTGASIDDLVQTMTQDKKATQGAMTLVLPRGLGQCFVAHDVDQDLVRDVLREALAA
ncbi:MAG: 3-dehydroquinate synthase [Alphaproteobacteria bacterium]|nr:3-dehydroquinate synthase [Alphaproteobacteria bacterium]MBV8548803.1 3-dehydroquinate synthase [Alphaproteobacteria bacterium]